MSEMYIDHNLRRYYYKYYPWCKRQARCHVEHDLM